MKSQRTSKRASNLRMTNINLKRELELFQEQSIADPDLRTAVILFAIKKSKLDLSGQMMTAMYTIIFWVALLTNHLFTSAVFLVLSIISLLSWRLFR